MPDPGELATRALQDPIKLDDLVGKCKIIKRMVPVIETAAKDYLESGGKLETWELKTRAGSRYISDMALAWDLLADVFTEEEFISGCKALRGRWLETYVAKGLAKDPKAKRAVLVREFDQLMGPATSAGKPVRLLERKANDERTN
jgi:hypothetical protein